MMRLSTGSSRFVVKGASSASSLPTRSRIPSPLREQMGQQRYSRCFLVSASLAGAPGW